MMPISTVLRISSKRSFSMSSKCIKIISRYLALIGFNFDSQSTAKNDSEKNMSIMNDSGSRQKSWYEKYSRKLEFHLSKQRMKPLSTDQKSTSRYGALLDESLLLRPTSLISRYLRDSTSLTQIRMGKRRPLSVYTVHHSRHTSDSSDF